MECQYCDNEINAEFISYHINGHEIPYHVSCFMLKELVFVVMSMGNDSYTWRKIIDEQVFPAPTGKPQGTGCGQQESCAGGAESASVVGGIEVGDHNA